jgi:predicted transcriptional regulator
LQPLDQRRRRAKAIEMGLPSLAKCLQLGEGRGQNVADVPSAAMLSARPSLVATPYAQELLKHGLLRGGEGSKVYVLTPEGRAIAEILIANQS